MVIKKMSTLSDVDEWYAVISRLVPTHVENHQDKGRMWVYSYDINEWVSRPKRTSKNSKFKI